MKDMYIDCSAGLSGSALLGALVDLGAKPDLLIKKIEKVLTNPFQLNFGKINKNNCIATTTFLQVNAHKEPVPATALTNHLITKVSVDDDLRQRLKSFFDKFIQAQAKVIGLPVEEVVMPEMEILRMTIITTGFFTALAQLEVDRITASPLPLGIHFFSQKSARLLLELAVGMSVRQYEGNDVPLTPLGVALLSFADEYGPLPEILLTDTGYGAAEEELLENVQVRILCGTGKVSKTNPGYAGTITVVETAIDDMNPEFFPFLSERLRAVGATDTFSTPIYMKKGRPAQLLTVLCSRSRLEEVLSIIFNEATTLGVRIREDERRILPRYFFNVSTPYGKVAIKAGCIKEGSAPVQYAPEFEDCKKLALQQRVPIKEVYAAAQQAAREKINK